MVEVDVPEEEGAAFADHLKSIDLIYVEEDESETEALPELLQEKQPKKG